MLATQELPGPGSVLRHGFSLTTAVTGVDQHLHGRCVGHALIKAIAVFPKPVLNVVDVPAADAEVRLDNWRRQRKRIHDLFAHACVRWAAR